MPPTPPDKVTPAFVMGPVRLYPPCLLKYEVWFDASLPSASIVEHKYVLALISSSNLILVDHACRLFLSPRPCYPSKHDPPHCPRHKTMPETERLKGVGFNALAAERALPWGAKCFAFLAFDIQISCLHVAWWHAGPCTPCMPDRAYVRVPPVLIGPFALTIVISHGGREARREEGWGRLQGTLQCASQPSRSVAMLQCCSPVGPKALGACITDGP